MSREGRPPKPRALKLLQGTFRKERALSEPEPTREIPPVPGHLSDEAKVEWGRVSQELYSLGLLTRIDRGALAAYCEAWSDWVEATRMCATTDGKDRKVIKTAAGNFIENPYYSIKKRAAELMHKFMTEFGMTPASRTRIESIPVDKSDHNPFSNLG